MKFKATLAFTDTMKEKYGCEKINKAIEEFAHNLPNTEHLCPIIFGPPAPNSLVRSIPLHDLCAMGEIKKIDSCSMELWIETCCSSPFGSVLEQYISWMRLELYPSIIANDEDFSIVYLYVASGFSGREYTTSTLECVEEFKDEPKEEPMEIRSSMTDEEAERMRKEYREGLHIASPEEYTPKKKNIFFRTYARIHNWFVLHF